MKIYTRTGDAGTTGLFGGPRVPKDDLRIEAYGTVDELNAIVGMVRSDFTEELVQPLDSFLQTLQNTLFVLGADLATPTDSRVSITRIQPPDTQAIESWIDELEADLPPLTQFILPGGAPSAARLHLARTVCRRAERLVVGLGKQEKINDECVKFLNRVSDFLFVGARWTNQKNNRIDEPWTPPER
jgi:cob(I)alamin adenosyltransferase